MHWPKDGPVLVPLYLDVPVLLDPQHCSDHQLGPDDQLQVLVYLDQETMQIYRNSYISI
jgi:hypothetical protein